MDMRITKTTTPKVKPPEAELGFGKFFSDHLFAMDYSAEKGWFDARIQPYAPFQMDPAAGVFHYGQAMFEGSKAFRGDDGHIRLFRPEQHARRMAIGAPRLCMPTPTEAQMCEAVRALVKVDSDWVPKSEGTSLYLRPTLIATEGFLGVRPATQYLYFVIASPAGSYFGGKGLKAVRIWVETHDTRAPRGGLGATKAGMEINPEARKVCAEFKLTVYAEKSEIPDGHFDIIISNHALEHCARPFDEILGLKSEVELGIEDGLPHNSAIRCDFLTLLFKRKLTHFVGTLSAAKMKELNRALNYALELGE